VHGMRHGICVFAPVILNVHQRTVTAAEALTSTAGWRGAYMPMRKRELVSCAAGQQRPTTSFNEWRVKSESIYKRCA